MLVMLFQRSKELLFVGFQDRCVIGGKQDLEKPHLLEIDDLLICLVGHLRSHPGAGKSGFYRGNAVDLGTNAKGEHISPGKIRKLV